jgi:hypothetical protein
MGSACSTSWRRRGGGESMKDFGRINRKKETTKKT